MRIILAIRDANLRLALELMLSEEPGAEIVATANNVESMLALVETNQPDILMLDYELPGKPILELLPSMVQDTLHRKIFVFGKSASIEAEALQAGAYAFIYKGEPPEKLLEAYRRLRVKQEDQTLPKPKTDTIEEKG